MKRDLRRWWQWGFLALVTLASLIALFFAVGPNSTQEANEFARTVVQILGWAVLAVGAYFTWRNLQVNQRNQQINLDNQIENQQANREQERLTQERQITERFTQAIEQLGAVDEGGEKRLELRLGGIYALGRIARDSERDHWPIMQILTMYVRVNAPVQQVDYRQLHLLAQEIGLDQTLPMMQPSPDVEAILQVFRERERYLGNGEAASFDLVRADLRGAQLYEAHFESSNFSWSNLDTAHLWGTKLPRANFFRASLAGADLMGADLQEATFIQCNLLAARLLFAQLQGADFTGAHL